MPPAIFPVSHPCVPLLLVSSGGGKCSRRWEREGLARLEGTGGGDVQRSPFCSGGRCSTVRRGGRVGNKASSTTYCRRGGFGVVGVDSTTPARVLTFTIEQYGVYAREQHLSIVSKPKHSRNPRTSYNIAKNRHGQRHAARTSCLKLPAPRVRIIKRHASPTVTRLLLP